MFLWPYAYISIAGVVGWFSATYFSKRSADHFPVLKLKKDYFAGLNYLINDQTDKALDVFLKMIEIDDDTVEMHFALGGLYRRRGEIDRAIKIHSSLLDKETLNNEQKHLALTELALDYYRTGVFDRAEKLYLKILQSDSSDVNSMRYLMRIYEQEKDWIKAINLAERLQRKSGESQREIIAFYYCELAQRYIRKDMMKACQYYKQALAVKDDSARALLGLADYHINNSEYEQAIDSYSKVMSNNMTYLPLVMDSIQQCYFMLNDKEGMRKFLWSAFKKKPTISVVLALVEYKQQYENDKAAIDFLIEHVRKYPTIYGLNYLVMFYLANSFGDLHQKLMILKLFLDRIIESKDLYQCPQCGFSGKSFYWLCPGCKTWGVMRILEE